MNNLGLLEITEWEPWWLTMERSKTLYHHHNCVGIHKSTTNAQSYSNTLQNRCLHMTTQHWGEQRISTALLTFCMLGLYTLHTHFFFWKWLFIRLFWRNSNKRSLFRSNRVDHM